MSPRITTGLGKLAAGAGNLGLRQFTVRDPGPGEALLEVIGAGICGTDLHIADDEFPSEPPVTMGHEVTGTVVSVGVGVDEAWVGRRVACETYFSYCERCEWCRAGRPNLCDERRSIGSRVDGGFARWLCVPARNLHALPDHVGRHAGALAEPLACVTNYLLDPSVVAAGDRVLVVGPGTMGNLTAQVARAAGGEVLVVGLPRDGHRLATAIGLDLPAQTVEPGGALEAERFDVVCECSGSAAGAILGMGLVRRRGRYVQGGIFGSDVTVPLDSLLYREAVVTSGNASTPQSWQRAMALLESGDVQLDPLVSEVVPLRDWERAFEATRLATGLKLVLDPSEEPS